MSWLKRRLPKKRWKRVCLYVVSVTMILLAADMILAAWWRRIDLGPETTDITSPLDKDGLPDYIREFNTRASEGITLENNAAPELLRIIGTERSPDWLRAKVLPPLGLPATTLPAQFVRYEDCGTHPEIKETLGDDETREMTRTPWKASEHPLWARWLDEQSGALPATFKALEKPNFYTPGEAAGERPMMYGFFLPSLVGERDLSILMAADAMHRLGEGDVAGFRKDTLGVMKHFRILGRRPSTLIGFLVAIAMDSRAARAIEGAAVAPGLLSEAQARELLHDVESAPPLPPVDRRILIMERWTFLDSVCALANRGTWGLGMNVDPKDTFALGGKIGRLLIPVHYNQILREANAHYDRLEKAFLQPTYHQRKTALQANDAEVEAWRERSFFSKIASPSRQATDLLFSFIMTPIGKVNQLSEQARMERDLARLALALRIYQIQHGEYPETLAPLAPAILPEIPQDTFIDAPFHYRRDAKGYILYSVGPDEKDDEGIEKAEGRKTWDIVVRAAE